MSQAQIWGVLSTGLMLITTTFGCIAEAPEDYTEPLGESQQALVRTAYQKDWGWRNFYALTVPTGSYVVQITWKYGWDVCTSTQAVMGLLPTSETTWSICASLKADYQAVDGKVNGCTSTTTHQPLPVYKYAWFDTSAYEVDYRIVDRGQYTYDDSGWMPSTPGNGCPRPPL